MTGFIKNKTKNSSQITVIKVRKYCKVIEDAFSVALKKYIGFTVKVFSKMCSKILLKSTSRQQGLPGHSKVPEFLLFVKSFTEQI